MYNIEMLWKQKDFWSWLLGTFEATRHTINLKMERDLSTSGPIAPYKDLKSCFVRTK